MHLWYTYFLLLRSNQKTSSIHKREDKWVPTKYLSSKNELAPLLSFNEIT